MTTAYGIESTVVGDTDYLHPKHPETSKEPRPPKQNNFVDNVDYALKERAFFVPIGKDGVIAALEKLDRQLTQVKSPMSKLVHPANPLKSREEAKFYQLK